MMTHQTIQSELQYPSRYLNVLGEKMHYIEAGQGDPMVFVHGIPSWCYTWRNVIPHLEAHAHCIAPDLIGLGRSAKPSIDYTLFDHIRYFDALMDSLCLDNVTLVMHAWGAVIGFDYAMRHPQQIKSLIFFETPHVRPLIDREMLTLPIQELRTVLNSDDQGRDMILNSNYYVDRILLSGVLRNLSDKERDYYREPFKTAADRQPIWQFLQDYPRGESSDKAVIECIQNYSDYLKQSPIPKLMLYAMPGFVTPISTVEWAKANIQSLDILELGEALHFVQESKPKQLADNIKTWYLQQKSKTSSVNS